MTRSSGRLFDAFVSTSDSYYNWISESAVFSCMQSDWDASVAGLTLMKQQVRRAGRLSSMSAYALILSPPSASWALPHSVNWSGM